MVKRTPDQYDWKKALFNDRRLSKHFTSPRRSNIKNVTLHHMTIVAKGSGSGTTSALEGCYNTWQTRQASANYGVSGNQVWQYVSDGDAAWANASSSNHETLSIEHANATAAPGWTISDETMTTGARLVATLHHLYDLGRPSRKTVKVHRDYYFVTACPGPYMMAHLDSYITNSGRFYDALRTGEVVAPITPTPAPKPPTAVWDLPSTWEIGSTGEAVTRLGKRLAVHAKALGLPAPYKVGPGPEFTETDRAAVAAFQKAQGWTGDDADGLPGPETFRRLSADPREIVDTVPVTAMFTPLAGYNGATAKGVTRWKANTDGATKIIRQHAPDLLATTELSNRLINRMKPRFVAALLPALILVNGGSDGRYIFRNPKSTKYLFRQLVTTPNTKLLRLRGDDKQGFIHGYEKDGARGVYAVFHAENEAGFDRGRVDQVLWFLGQVEAAAVAAKVPPENVLVVMDGNSMAMVAAALQARVFGGRRYRVVGFANYVGWDRKSAKPFDLAVTTGDATASDVSSAGNGDHDWLLIHHNLTK